MSTPAPIVLSDKPNETARWVWKNLVPKEGQATTVQGELIRAIERLAWEAQTNGNINWDDRFEMFVDFIERALCEATCFGEKKKEEIRADLARLRNFDSPYVDDDLYDRLTCFAEDFCRAFPLCIPRAPEPLQYR